MARLLLRHHLKLGLSPNLFVLSAKLLSNKIRQDQSRKGIKIFGNEIKASSFPDDTNLFCADLTSVESALRTYGWRVWSTSWFETRYKKSKEIWLGKWKKNKLNPLQLKWLHTPVRILGIHVSCDEKGNSEWKFQS